MSILPQLQLLGLSEKEAKAYVVLVNAKKGTAQSVADAAGIKRPTCYQVLDSLIAKKLVAVTKFRNVKDYRALPLESLKGYVRSQVRVANRILPEMQKQYNSRAFKVRLRIYHGLQDVKTLFEKSLREKKPVYIFGSEKEFSTTLGTYWDFYLKRARQNTISPQFKATKSRVSVIIWNDKIAFASLQGKTQVFAFKNAGLHKLYEDLWMSY